MQRFGIHEVDRDLHRAARRLVKSKRPAYVVSGPITGYLQVCMALGWEVISACEVKDHYGIRHDMRKRSPAFMKGLAKDASRSGLDASYRTRRKLHGKTSWWGPIDAVRRKMKGNREKAAVFANLASGCCWTSSTLYKRGLSPTPQCGLCGADGGTYAHRLLHCAGLAKFRQSMTGNVAGYLRELAKEGALEEQLWSPVWPDMISVFTDDAPVRCIGPPGNFVGRIYTDGSSIAPLDYQSRRAGWAVVTLDDEGELYQVNYGAVPPVLAHTRLLEMRRIWLLRLYLGRLTAPGYRMCMSTAKAPSGVRQPEDLAAHLRVHKVKAHQRVCARMTAEQRRDAKGNEMADAYAKKGALEHVRGGQYQFDRYNEMLENHTKALLFAVELDYRMWKEGCTDHVALRKADRVLQDEFSSDARGRKRGAGSKVVKWEPLGWLLLLSTRAIDVKAPVDLSERLEIVPECVPVLTHTLRNYDVWLHGDRNGSLAACDRCGAYATSTPRLL
eukprot:2573829-Amphidinium_carterae.1